MKRSFLFALVFGCVAIVTAQERVLDKAEFDAVTNGGYDHKTKWKGEKYRMTVTTTSTVSGRPATDHSSKNITEYGSAMETRNFHTSSFGGKASPMKETIIIGKWAYTRSENGQWTRKEYSPAIAAPKELEESTRKVLSSKTDYRYLGQGTLGERPVHMYVKTERKTSFNEKTGENTESESKDVYWIDGKGVILKSEFTSEYRGKITTQTGVIMEWELDPTITVKAPEIAQ